MGGGEGTTEDEMVDGITDSMDMSLSEVQEMVKDREAWHAAVQSVWSVQSLSRVRSLQPHELQHARPVHHQLPEFTQTHSAAVHRVAKSQTHLSS